MSVGISVSAAEKGIYLPTSMHVFSNCYVFFGVVRYQNGIYTAQRQRRASEETHCCAFGHKRVLTVVAHLAYTLSDCSY